MIHYNFLKLTQAADAEAVLARCREVYAELEAELGLPVLFADQYTLWHALRTIGVDAKLPHLGKIFEY